MSDKTNEAPGWLKMAADFGPLVLFFIAFKMDGLTTATAVIIPASLVSLAVIWGIERRVPIMPLVTAVVLTVFGGLTLWLDDPMYVKLKPTIVQGLFAAVLLGGLAFNRPLLKPLMGKMIPLTDEGWRGLSFRYAMFFVAMALLNEIVWRTQSEDFWVNFKFFGLTGLTFAFILTQMPFMNRHMLDPETASAAPAGGDSDD